MKTRSILALLLLLVPATLVAQGTPKKPRPVPTVPSGQQMPGTPGAPQVNLPDPCQNLMNQPIINLSLRPAEIYRDDAITASWEVRDRRPEVQWGYPVHLETFGDQPAFPDPAPRRGSHTYSTPSVSGRVTLTTRCGEHHVDWERIPDAFLEAVEPTRGAAGSVVRLRGSNFGARQGSSTVEIIADGQTRTMTVNSWGNVRIEARVPNNMPTGPAEVRVVKGGRRPTREQRFQVVRSIVVDTALARFAADDAGLSAVQIVVTDGVNASQVTLGGGLPALSFTVPGFQRDVPDAANIVEVLLAPVPGLPIPKKVRFRAHDIRSNSVDVSVAGGQLVLAVGFEEQEPEVIGEARTCFWAVAGCVDPAWRDEHCPDIQASRARVTFRLTPGVSGGALTFPSADDDFQADFQIRGFAGWLAPLLGDWAGQAKRQIRDGIHDTLNTVAVRNAAATAVMARLRGLGVARIVSVTPAGNQITVEYE